MALKAKNRQKPVGMGEVLLRALNMGDLGQLPAVFNQPPMQTLQQRGRQVAAFAEPIFNPVGEGVPKSGNFMDKAMWALSQPGVMPTGMTVFHGTPHKFAPTPKNPLGEFDLSKIGTGEGAQAYGHGIYLAEDPSVANYYLRKPAMSQEISSNIGKVADDEALGAADALRTWRGMGKVWEGGPPTAKELEYFNRTPRGRGYVKMAQAIQEGRIPSERPSGTMYKVDLPDEHIGRMLDWDAPLSQQPEAVRRIAAELPGVRPYNGMPLAGGGSLKIVDDPDFGPKYFMVSGKSEFRLSPKDVQNLVGNAGEGKAIYQELRQKLGSDQAVSEFLRQRGIPGLRYLDQGSRTAGKGTRNFVMFDTSPLNILGVE